MENQFVKAHDFEKILVQNYFSHLGLRLPKNLLLFFSQQGVIVFIKPQFHTQLREKG